MSQGGMELDELISATGRTASSKPYPCRLAVGLGEGSSRTGGRARAHFEADSPYSGGPVGEGEGSL